MRRWLLAVLVAGILAPAQLNSGPTVFAQACAFTLGFKLLRDQIPDIVGQCLENEHGNPPSRDTVQRTTGGLLVWRQADNWTAFTDGSQTWVNGPYGLQRRLNYWTVTHRLTGEAWWIIRPAGAIVEALQRGFAWSAIPAAASSCEAAWP